MYKIQIMKIKFLQAEELYINSNLTLREVCSKIKIDRYTFSNYLKSKNISTRKKIDCDDTVFEKIDDEYKAYWLGFLYADGSVTYNLNRKKYTIELSLAEKDYNHLEKFRTFLKSNRNIKYRDKQKAYRFTINSKKMCEDLINLGCVPTKSLILRFPNITQVPEYLINHFIRGYFDGDGCISLDLKKNTFSTSLLGTFEFVNVIVDKYKPSLNKYHKNNTYTLRFKVQDALIFLYDIYNNSNVYLDRKFEKYNFILKNCRSGKKFLELLESKNGED